MFFLNEDMEIGIAKIDDQHKELFDGLNRLVSISIRPDVNEEEMYKHLDFLEAHIICNFADEEALQKQSGDPKHEHHKKQHQIFLNEFYKLKNEFMENGISAKFSAKLDKSIINGIVTHIKNNDMEFARHYKGYDLLTRQISPDLWITANMPRN